MPTFDADYEYLGKLDLLNVGTRYEHMQDLKLLWECGAAVINGFEKSTLNADRLRKLQIAIEMLDNALSSLGNYYRDVTKLAFEVNSTPKDPDKITSGRGTPLAKPYGT